MAATSKKPSKPIFKTEIPFTETSSPTIAPQDRDVILDLVCTFLEPLGTHRKTHIQPSKGRKRKRSSKANIKSKDTTNSSTTPESTAPEQPPPPPALTTHILVGLNAVTRHLNDLAALTAPHTLLASTEEAKASHSKNEEGLRKLDLLIIPHPAPHSSLPHAHLPTLLYLSHPPSSPQKDETPTPASPPSSRGVKIVCLPTQAEPKLAAALHIPRVGAIGILEGAPGAETLVKYAREKVGELKCPWIEEAMRGEWKGVKISGG
ncbi:hypothetical protein BDV96DRAFT_648894 [Lophiotrema nucula]|uniref:Uncharacterized protein n=1 Tax=Lophiotrema nucula TaxID=690887 RepID=A0A6A5YZR6_9PLEO|nr:hypothetical protein BDV96DRAFT_648894 [Lophiotrema nucula]